MTTSTKTFTAANLARSMSIDPKRARALLRKTRNLPPCVEGAHDKNDAWTFDSKHRARIVAVLHKLSPATSKDEPADATA